MPEPFGVPVSTFDGILRPTLMRTKGTPEVVVSALLVQGLSEGMHREDVRRWIKSRVVDGAGRADVGDVRSQHGFDEEPAVTSSGAASTGTSPSFYELITYGKHWKRLWTAAEEHVLSSPSFTGDVRGSHLETTRRLYGRLLLPLLGAEPISYKSSVTLRVMFTVLALRLLEDEKGWDTAVLTHPRVAATLDWNRKTSERSCTTLREMRVIHKLGAQQGVPSRFKTVRLYKELSDALTPYEESIESLVDGKPDALAAVILSATHPAWSYSGTLTHAHWLLLLAGTVGISVELYGMSRAREKALRGTLTREHINPSTAARYLPRILDEIADSPVHGRADSKTGELVTARDAFALSWATYKKSAEAREEIVVARQEKARKHHADIEHYLEQLPIPKMSARRSLAEENDKRFDEWFPAIRDLVASENPDDDFKLAGAEMFSRRLIKNGYGPKVSPSIAAKIMGPIESEPSSESVVRLEPLPSDSSLSGAQLIA